MLELALFGGWPRLIAQPEQPAYLQCKSIEYHHEASLQLVEGKVRGPPAVKAHAHPLNETSAGQSGIQPPRRRKTQGVFAFTGGTELGETNLVHEQCTTP